MNNTLPRNSSSSSSSSSGSTMMNSKSTTTTSSSSSSSSSCSRNDDANLLLLLQLLQDQAPSDILPNIIAFAGAATRASLAQTNRFWSTVACHESSWQALCHASHKVRRPNHNNNNNAATQTYRQCFCEDLRVPSDFPTVEAALKLANREFALASQQGQQRKTITIRLELGKGLKEWQVDDTLVVNAVGENASLVLDILPSTHTIQPQWQSCASLAMDTDIPNQPLLQLVAGHLCIKHLRLEHYSPVHLSLLKHTKNVNAAILIDDDDDDDDDGMELDMDLHADMELEESSSSSSLQNKKSLTVSNTIITSYSGRGILNRCPDHPSYHYNETDDDDHDTSRHRNDHIDRLHHTSRHSYCPIQIHQSYIANLWQ